MADIMVILAALAALITLAYRGWSLLLLTPALALIAVIVTGDAPVLATYTQIFMAATGNFIILYFPIFLLGAVFGKLMDASGSAKALANGIIRALGAERALLAVVLSCAVMTYGGVSLFVVSFAVYPIAAALFRQAEINKRLIPATIALGAFTFTMTALPGTPAIQNAIPMPFFGTTPFAAPGLGIISAVVMFLTGSWLLQVRARALGRGYGPYEEAVAGTPGEGPSALIAAVPLVLVIVINVLFTFVVIPMMDTSFLALPAWGEADIGDLRGIWSIIAALTISTLVLTALNFARLRAGLAKLLDQGAQASLLPIFNTASLVGFGSVIASLTGFAAIRERVVGLGGDNPLISLALSAGLLSGMTGSASGGMSIALATLGDTFLAMAEAQGISPDLLHRVVAVATGGLDTLPHNGAVITLLAISGLTHREAYRDLALVGIGVPLVALVVLITLGTFLGSF